MGSQYTEKANATLVATCAACGTAVSTARGNSVGLKFRGSNGLVAATGYDDAAVVEAQRGMVASWSIGLARGLDRACGRVGS